MRSVCLGCAALALLLFSSSASAAPCGTPKAAGEEPTLGTLTLKAEESEPNVNAGRKTDERRMVFVFGVSECSLAANEKIRAKVRSSDVDAAAFGAAEIEPERSLLFVDIPVKPDEFTPGKHSAIVTVGGSNLNSSVSKVTMQRSENKWWIPVGICALAALFALFGVGLRVRAEAEGKTAPKFHPLWFGVMVLAAFAAAAVVCQTTYFEPEIWESGIGPGVLLFIAAITAATGGSAVAAGKVWTKEDTAAPDADADGAKAPGAVTPRVG